MDEQEKKAKKLQALQSFFETDMKIKEVLIKGVLKKETSKDQNIKILYTDLI